jgi:hypothetical protein
MHRLERFFYIAVIVGLLALSRVTASPSVTEMRELNASVIKLTEALSQSNDDIRKIKNNVELIQADISGIGVGSPIEVKVKAVR